MALKVLCLCDWVGVKGIVLEWWNIPFLLDRDVSPASCGRHGFFFGGAGLRVIFYDSVIEWEIDCEVIFHLIQ